MSGLSRLGLELEMPVLLSLAFPLDTLGKEVSLGSAHLVRFDQADINRLAPPCFATQELLPRLLKDLSFRQGNLSQLLEVIWKAVADFLLAPEGRCPVCLAVHQTTGLWRRSWMGDPPAWLALSKFKSRTFQRRSHTPKTAKGIEKPSTPQHILASVL
eukprot:s6272_g2.t1